MWTLVNVTERLHDFSQANFASNGMTWTPRDKSGRRYLANTCIPLTAILSGLLAICLGPTRFSSSHGLVATRVEGDSMFPTLMGSHLQTQCRLCGIEASVSDACVIPGPVRCPHCGAADVVVQRAKADRLWIDKARLQRELPTRGDLVAFREPGCEPGCKPGCKPGRPGRLSVKRVVGLPGEHVVLKGGTIYCDGEPICIHEGLVVNDDRFRPRGVSQWRPFPEHAWRRSANAFALLGSLRSDRDGDSPAWLTYCPSSSVPGTTPGRIYDDVPFNRAVRRALHPVTNVSVEGVLRMRGTGQLLLRYVPERGAICRMVYDRGASTVELEGRERRSIGTGRVGPEAVRFRIARRGAHVTFVLGNDFRGTVDTDGESSWGTFCVGGTYLSLTVSDLMVRREIYVTEDSPEFIADTHWHLGPGQYFVLGENSPVSRDSRHFAAISRADLVGFVRRLSP